MLPGIVFLAVMGICALLAAWMFPTWRPRGLMLWPWTSANFAGRVRSRLKGWWWVVALMVVPPMAVWWWGTRTPTARTLDAYDDAARVAPPAVVGDLLRGEQLVPPPALPPEVFATAEVEVVRPMLSMADRRWDQMDPEFVQRLLTLFKHMKAEGYEMALLEGYRSPERQARLQAMGAHVTNAGAWQSYHQHGLAADCAFLREGKLVISEKDPWAMRGYQLYGELAERFGLTWGGRWRLMDFGHVEWRRPGVRLGPPGGNTR
jgi:peptidoglycan L-alanyl-D-glutamate endopeptidase CwlK